MDPADLMGSALYGIPVRFLLTSLPYPFLEAGRDPNLESYPCKGPTKGFYKSLRVSILLGLNRGPINFEVWGGVKASGLTSRVWGLGFSVWGLGFIGV